MHFAGSKMTLVLYNTLKRKKEVFKPLKKGQVLMYACGPTVYDYAHIGNMRTYVFQDVLRRYLEYKGFRVNEVVNLTDVDDKTIRASRKQGVSLESYTQKYINAFFEDIDALHIERAQNYPRATQHIPEMVDLIKKLVQKGYAYRSDDGTYYAVSKFKGYGKLGRVKIKRLRKGIRINTDEYGKNEASDFALWKTWNKKDGNVFWATEIGKGRPGWHIECSAMSMKYLGTSLDIHTGAVDLIFPHHENEIAQSEAVTGKKFVKYWLHGEHLLVNNKRMGKSLRNYYTLRDLRFKGYNPLALRYLYFTTQYRDKLNFSFSSLKAAQKALDGLFDFVQRLNEVKEEKKNNKEVKTLIKKTKKEFKKNLDDDLNMPKALASFFKFIKAVNKLIEKNKLGQKDAKAVYKQIVEFDRVFGFGLKQKEQKQEVLLSEDIKYLVDEREKARKEQNWAKADAIRDQLLDEGIEVEDTSRGPRIKRFRAEESE
jgi:cysteinyl-tRNA synthetase